MKKLYRKFRKSIDRVANNLHIFKLWVFEWVNIMKKKEIYSNVRLTNEQRKQIDDFWKKNYKKNISTRWHRLYQSYTGTFDHRYFPEIIFSTELEPILNPRNICKVYSDKGLLELFYKDDKNVKIPKTYIVNCSGIFYDGNRKIITEKRVLDLLHNIGDSVLKVTMGESSGNGVTMHHFKNGIDTKTGRCIKNILEDYKVNFIIQERIFPNEKFYALYKKSINTIRVITYIVDDKIYHAPLTLRIGRGGKEVDNIHAGGLAIGVSDEGTLNKIAFTEMQQRYDRHPDSGVVFNGYVVPKIPIIIDTAKRLHEKTPHMRMISWDFTLDNDDNIVLLEINIMAQSIWFPQMVNGRSIFGENTERMLQFISNKMEK